MLMLLENNILDFIFLILVISISYYTNKKFVVILLGIFYDLLFSDLLFLYFINCYAIYDLVYLIKNKLHIHYFSYLITLILALIISYIFQAFIFITI